jgi:hypothetical protein
MSLWKNSSVPVIMEKGPILVQFEGANNYHVIRTFGQFSFGLRVIRWCYLADLLSCAEGAVVPEEDSNNEVIGRITSDQMVITKEWPAYTKLSCTIFFPGDVEGRGLFSLFSSRESEQEIDVVFRLAEPMSQSREEVSP